MYDGGNPLPGTLYECGQEPHEGAVFATNVARDVGNLALAPKRCNELFMGDYMRGDSPIVDVWMLSSERYHAEALRALKHHIFLMHCVYAKYQERVFGPDAPDEETLVGYHTVCADAVVEALLTGMIIEGPKKAAQRVDWSRRTWEARSSENQKTIASLKVRKTLNRSHAI